MNAETFAEWFRRQGQTVYRTESSYWHSQGPRMYQAFPYHWVIQPDEKEISDFIHQTGSLGLRFSTPLQARFGQVSYHMVFAGREYDIDMLGKRTRKNVRRGLKFCQVEQIPFDILKARGLELQLDTLKRQGRDLVVTKEWWQRLCDSSDALPGFQAWGAFVGKELAASLIAFQMEDCVYILYQWCKAQYLDENVNNALSFTVTQEMVSRPTTKLIFYGLHSLDAPASVDEFKFHMGYMASPVRQQVAFHPIIRPLMNPVSYKLISAIKKARPGDPLFAKTEGMMRFYLQGKHPLKDQNWPENLLDQKESVLQGVSSDHQQQVPVSVNG